MEVIRSSGFKKIYYGLMVKLLIWLIIPFFIASKIAVLLHSDTLELSESSDNLGKSISALFFGVGLIAKIAVLNGMTESAYISGWLQKCKKFYFVEVFADAVMTLAFGMSAYFLDAAGDFTNMEVLNYTIYEISIALYCVCFLFIRYFSLHFYLNGLHDVWEQCGCDEKHTTAIIKLRKQLMGVCSGMVVCLALIFGLAISERFISEQIKTAINVLSLMLVFLLLIFLCIRLAVQIRIVVLTNKTVKVIEKILE